MNEAAIKLNNPDCCDLEQTVNMREIAMVISELEVDCCVQMGSLYTITKRLPLTQCRNTYQGREIPPVCR